MVRRRCGSRVTVRETPGQARVWVWSARHRLVLRESSGTTAGRRGGIPMSRRIATSAVLAILLSIVGCTGPRGEPPRPSATPTTSSVIPLPGPAATPDPLPQRVVVLDPGHNGRNPENPARINQLVPDGRGGMKACNTTGTATDAGYPEHEFNWDVAQRVRLQLQNAGVRVILTRPDDDGVGPCVDVRGRAGEDADADAVVAIHADGSAADHHGYHVAVSDPPLNDAQREPATALARAVRDAMRGAGFVDSNYIGTEGISLRRDLAGLNLATRPTVLVECANMRNPEEAAVVSSEAGRERYATAITTGILAFLG